MGLLFGFFFFFLGLFAFLLSQLKSTKGIDNARVEYLSNKNVIIYFLFKKIIILTTI